MKTSKSDLQISTEPASKKSRGKSRLFWRVFWLSFLVISLAYAWFCFYAPSSSVSWRPGYADAQDQAEQLDKPMILFFTATWCVPCRIMKRTVWADEQVAAAVNEHFIPVMLYANDPGMADVFSRYNVGATPTVIITDSEGTVLDWFQGRVEKEEFMNFITNWHGDD